MAVAPVVADVQFLIACKSILYVEPETVPRIAFQTVLFTINPPTYVELLIFELIAVPVA